MGMYLNPGNGFFMESLRSKIYVDKTGLIGFTNEVLGTEQKNICISRPRRFGKSMAIKMLAAYYDRTCDSSDMFCGLNISNSDSYQEHLNSYDVILMNMQKFLARADSVKDMVDYLQEKIIGEVKSAYPEYVKDLQQLSVALAEVYSYTKKPFIILIDEWDCIFREHQHDSDAQTKYLDFLRDLLKDAEYIGLAYMTGILPIKKYGTHSALNMFSEFSMTNPKRLAQYVGFTEGEVKDLCQKYDMDFPETQRWYDGYCFRRNPHIYNPQSVVFAMWNEEFDSYWTQTETYEALKSYIDMNYDGLKDAVIMMLGGEKCKVDTGTFQNDMTTFTSKDDVLTLLIHLGYLAYDMDSKQVFIPNEEVRAEFIRAVKTCGWNEVMKVITESHELLEATWAGNEAAVAEQIDKVHLENTSVFV